MIIDKLFVVPNPQSLYVNYTFILLEKQAFYQKTAFLAIFNLGLNFVGFYTLKDNKKRHHNRNVSFNGWGYPLLLFIDG